MQKMSEIYLKNTEEYNKLYQAGDYHKIVKKHIKIKLIGNK
jgi:hypothetical protein